jgi:hypothetical protein
VETVAAKAGRTYSAWSTRSGDLHSTIPCPAAEALDEDRRAPLRARSAAGEARQRGNPRPPAGWRRGPRVAPTPASRTLLVDRSRPAAETGSRRPRARQTRTPGDPTPGVPSRATARIQGRFSATADPHSRRPAARPGRYSPKCLPSRERMSTLLAWTGSPSSTPQTNGAANSGRPLHRAHTGRPSRSGCTSSGPMAARASSTAGPRNAPARTSASYAASSPAAGSGRSWCELPTSSGVLTRLDVAGRVGRLRR